MVHVLLVVLLAIASACNRSGDPAPPESTAAEPAAALEPVKPVTAAIPEVLARVNGEAVTRLEFEEAISAVEQRAQSPVPADQRDRVFRGVLDQLVGVKLLAQEAAARKIAVPDADVDAQVARLRQQFPSEDAFSQVLKRQNKTVEALKADTRRNLAIEKMLEQALAAKIAVTPQQTQDFYEKNPDQFRRSEEVRASHILIGVPQGADVAAKAAARRKAEGLLKQVKAGGDFGALATTNSQDPGSAVKGGDLGFFPRGQMVPPFDQAAFTLAPGATSELVETQFGYHIIRVTGKREAGTATLEEVRPQLEAYLQNVNRQREMQAFVDTLKAKGKVEVLI